METEVVLKQEPKTATPPQFTPAQNLGALGLAVLIDFTDMVPSELLFAIGMVPFPIGYEAGISIVVAAYLNHLGVPIPKALAMAGTDLIPVIDLVPWCTLAVLDRRYGFKLPYLTQLFNY